jgi:carboxylesterase
LTGGAAPTANTEYPVLPGAEAFRSAGSGERAHIGIALIHGFTGSPISLRPLAERLASRGFAIELPRLPGHGTSERDMARTRYADWFSAADSAVSRLEQSTERAVVVGLSMGAAISLDIAARAAHPKLAGVVTINVQILDRQRLAMKLGPLVERVMPFAPAALAGLRKDDIAKPGVSERAYASVPTAAGNSFTRELPRVRDSLAGITCPVLVVWSREDHSVNPENSKVLASVLARGLASELVLERSYHVATLDYDLELIEANVADFAERVAAPRKST